MRTFAEKVAGRREALKLSQPQLGKLAGLSYQAIQQIESGQTKSTRRLLQLAAALQVSPDWLTSNKDEPVAAAPNSTPTAPPRSGEVLTSGTLSVGEWPRDVPILGTASCGDDGMFELNGETHDHAKRPPRLAGVKGAYALWVTGKSMMPWRKNGDLVYVHPHQPVSIGDFVVVELHSEGDGEPKRAFIKELVRRTGKELRLRQYNPQEEVTIPMSKVSKIHRIVDWSELLGL